MGDEERCVKHEEGNMAALTRNPAFFIFHYCCSVKCIQVHRYGR